MEPSLGTTNILLAIMAAVRKGTAPTKLCPLTPWMSWKGCQCESPLVGRDAPRVACKTRSGGTPTAIARRPRLPHSPTAA